MRNWSKIAAWIALLGIVPAHARAQDALTVAGGGRGIGESCVTEIGQKANIFGKHGLKLEIVYTDGGGETQQAVVSNSAQIGVTSGFLGALSLYSKGAPVRIIGGLLYGSPAGLLDISEMWNSLNCSMRQKISAGCSDK
jgi:NitT/TauT family transport system substrate-binding protein